jgi:hypothetical protein
LFRRTPGLYQRDYYTSAKYEALQGVKDPRGTGWHDCLAYGDDLGVASHPSGARPGKTRIIIASCGKEQIVPAPLTVTGAGLRLGKNNNTLTWSGPSGVVGFTGQRRIAPAIGRLHGA